jgi:glycosyltransferase involved in cell wall biosynthesis
MHCGGTASPFHLAARLKFRLRKAPDMKVLIVTFAFPPSNVIGAIRVGKLARYLDRRGHDLRVLTTDIFEDRSLPLEIPRERVVYTEYRKRRDWFDRFTRPMRRRSAVPEGTGSRVAPAREGSVFRTLREKLRQQYYGLIHIPDMRADWVKTAVPAGERLMEGWRPDIIFASAPPYTGFIIADRLSRAFNIPWIADFRDLWVDNPYYGEPAWRRPIDAVLERRTLQSAAGLVTVSPSWAEILRHRHGKAAEAIYNGYAEEDFPQLPPQTSQGDVLTIRHVGSIYRGFRDPSALFAAIGLLPEAIRNQIIVEFFGDSNDDLLAAAAAHGVTGSVAVRPRVPYRRALELQMEADILLLLQSNDQRDEGNLPAKLFEYLYARRPILLIGYEHGIAARLITERGAGLVCNSPMRIRDQLQSWIADKRAGRLTRLPPSVSEGLGRDEQFRRLEQIFSQLLDERRGATGVEC